MGLTTGTTVKDVIKNTLEKFNIEVIKWKIIQYIFINLVIYHRIIQWKSSS